MSIKIGKCNNLEFCRLAVTQRKLELPDNEPFICPQCSADLQLLGTKKVSGGNRTLMIGLQAGALVAGAGIIGWKLLLAPSVNSVPQQLAQRATPAELALAANPDAPADAPAAAEPAVQAATPAQAGAPLPPAKILLRVAGSDMLTAHLARRLAAGYLGLIGDASITTELTADPAVVQIVGSQAGQREAIAITAGTSASGLAALAAGQADLALSLRQVSGAEQTAMARLGDSTGSEHVIGVEGVAVIVNPANPVASISSASLRDMLTGRLTDWSGVGQPARPLHMYVRDPSANPADSAAGLLGGDARAAIPLGTDAEVAAAVRRDAAAIGLIDLSEAAGAHLVAIADAASPPVAATDLTVAEESYPLTRRLYLYTGAATGSSFARRFAEYAGSSSGQAVVAASGFVSLSVKPAAPSVAAPQAAAQTGGSDALAAAVGGGVRLSTTFRFEAGSVELDSRALRDVDRLASYVRSHGTDGAHLLLVGFADNIGAPATNLDVAQKQAEAVAAALGRAGLAGEHTKSFGADYPVADNATNAGREKNRRVEAYLMP